VAVDVSTLPVVVLRDGIRTIASGSGCELVRATTLKPALLSCDCTDGSTGRAVEVPEYFVETDGSGSPMGGNGRCGVISGRGLYDEMEFGVEVARVDGGGHSGRGGSCSTFSLGVVAGLLGVISWSLSLVKPLLIRWNRAFIVQRRIFQWSRAASGGTLMGS
jgi:hypothetical protein